MVSRVRVSKSSIEGTGVFACFDLVEGEVVLRIDDSHVVNQEYPVPEEEAVHFDYLGAGRVIWMQAPERYINHSCDPNVYIRTRNCVREVLALRSIRAGEEIAYDYSINGFGDTVWTCTCQASRCRHSVHSDFFHLPLELQREYLPLLDDWFRQERADKVKALDQPRGETDSPTAPT